MKRAIQEHLLPGDTLLEKLQIAKDTGYDGVEFFGQDLTPRIPQIIDALLTVGLAASTVNAGGCHLLHPEIAQRDAAIGYLRQSMANAVDLNAAGVVFCPQLADTPHLPDLHPYKSTIELEAELLVTQLRATLADLAYAMGTKLFLAPRHDRLVKRIDMAITVLEKNRNHPHIGIAPHTQHMRQAEQMPIEQVLQQYAQRIQVVHITEPDPTAITQGLQAGGFEGWLIAAAPDVKLV
ncbi:MAG: hypothetical protein CUN56_09240 [Phototrophicales bacterium]|nr:MAG: hypothetical protein CUN56_09240 [Phototrophicales bacterium]